MNIFVNWWNMFMEYVLSEVISGYINSLEPWRSKQKCEQFFKMFLEAEVDLKINV